MVILLTNVTWFFQTQLSYRLYKYNKKLALSNTYILLETFCPDTINAYSPLIPLLFLRVFSRKFPPVQICFPCWLDLKLFYIKMWWWIPPDIFFKDFHQNTFKNTCFLKCFFVFVFKTTRQMKKQDFLWIWWGE